MIFRTGDESKGPFNNVDEMHDNMIERYNNLVHGNDNLAEYTTRIYREAAGAQSIVFTHGDLGPQNIMVENGHISGIVDWEQAGWYPEYWERESYVGKCWDMGYRVAIEYCEVAPPLRLSSTDRPGD